MSIATIKESVSIFDLLDKIGVGTQKGEAGRERGVDMFKSWWRGENNASVSIFDKGRRWKDHQSGEFGDVIDLAQKSFGCSRGDALKRLDTSNFEGCRIPERHEDKQSSGVEITRNSEVKHSALFQYAESRGISRRVLLKYCREIGYRNGDSTYFGIAFQNQTGGFEVRNKYLPVCIGRKDISIIGAGRNKAVVMEGFFDFLTLVEMSLQGRLNLDLREFTAIVLNSVEMKNRVDLKPYSEAILILDNDRAGDEATVYLQELGANDYRSVLFSRKFNDLNDFWTGKESS